MPLSPAHRRSHITSTLSLSDVITPSPVTTTRRLLMSWFVVSCQVSVVGEGARVFTNNLQLTTNNFLFARMLLDVVDRLADGLDLFGFLIGDRQLKLVLELHDQLDGIQRVGVEVVDEVGFAGDLALVHSHLLADDLDD